MHPRLELSYDWAKPPASRHRGETRTHPWRIGLPADWQHAAVPPLRFEIHWEYEADAARVIGCDAQGTPCYCAHRYALTQLRSEEDDQFYESVVYREERFAWRLQDGRWLVRHTVATDEDCDHSRSSVFLSDAMPR
jgi:hypothetical protein